ncbi:uncharacterized protein LOC143671311 isoform X2 [Tamandua tetradactyla]|uniref:uncharacterized protein LOC143671311 isoform X2 n=1 Tax=Tamandua tetradactyla TaxID=48850 RepID=UPI00405439DC
MEICAFFWLFCGLEFSNLHRESRDVKRPVVKKRRRGVWVPIINPACFLCLLCGSGVEVPVCFRYLFSRFGAEAREMPVHGSLHLRMERMSHKGNNTTHSCWFTLLSLKMHLSSIQIFV